MTAELDADCRVEGIVSLEVRRRLRGRGLGARTVAALGGTLRVYDVRPSARGFWERSGFSPARSAGRLDGSADAADVPRAGGAAPSP